MFCVILKIDGHPSDYFVGNKTDEVEVANEPTYPYLYRIGRLDALPMVTARREIAEDIVRRVTERLDGEGIISPFNARVVTHEDLMVMQFSEEICQKDT